MPSSLHLRAFQELKEYARRIQLEQSEWISIMKVTGRQPNELSLLVIG